jgi:NADH-quinone oxidoreductase subunit J
MTVIFYIAAVVSVVATLLAITRGNAVHALLYLIVSLLSVAVVFYTLGAPFVAVLEVIIYAGAIMVLFLFAIMVLNLGPGGPPREGQEESQWLRAGAWFGPGILAAVLIGELIYLFVVGGKPLLTGAAVGPEHVGASLFGPYLLVVELASMLLLAGLVGAYHLGRPAPAGSRGPAPGDSKEASRPSDEAASGMKATGPRETEGES